MSGRNRLLLGGVGASVAAGVMVAVSGGADRADFREVVDGVKDDAEMAWVTSECRDVREQLRKKFEYLGFGGDNELYVDVSRRFSVGDLGTGGISGNFVRANLFDSEAGALVDTGVIPCENE